MNSRKESKNYVEEVIKGIISINELIGYFHTSIEHLEDVNETLHESMNFCLGIFGFIDRNENREQMKQIMVDLLIFRGKTNLHYNTLRNFVKIYKQNIESLKTNKIKDPDSLTQILAADFEMLEITCYFLAKQNELFTNIKAIFQKAKFDESNLDHIKFLEIQKVLKEKQKQISESMKLFEFRI